MGYSISDNFIILLFISGNGKIIFGIFYLCFFLTILFKSSELSGNYFFSEHGFGD